MLRELRIRNFAIIEDLSIPLGAGLNIITGDTGAGKSILVGVVGLVLGGRGSSEMIRTGADQARLTALFDLGDRPEQMERIRTMGVEISDGELVVQRTLSRSGKSRVTVNGDPVPVGLLCRIGENLVEIHGQHEHHSLLDRENHIVLVDAFGRLAPLLARYEEAYERLVGIQRELHRLQDEAMGRDRRIDFLQYQIREIDAVAPRMGEEEELSFECGLLRNAERIATLARGAFALLYESDDAISDRLGRTLAMLNELASLDARTGDLVSQCTDLKYGLEEVAHTLRDHASGMEPDPIRLESLEDRLEALRNLKRKYGGGLEQVLRFRQEAEEELSRLTAHEENLSRLNEKSETARAEAVRLARQLSQSREKASRRMERELESQLGELGMSGTRFVVRQERHPGVAGAPADPEARTLTRRGLDRIEFLVSPNAGEDPRPLSRIASGGELSRIMLSIKTVLAEADRVGILIFDEIDAGIGGGVAEILGKKLHDTARGRQVICVTHLPQVASLGDVHHHIEKQVQDGRTRVAARLLKGSDRVQEIARMLGGVEMTKTTVQHAREMLKLSHGL